MIYQKVYLKKKLIVGSIYQYLLYFQNKNFNRKNMQYENTLRIFFLSKKQDLVFKNTFSQEAHLEKGGSSYNQGHFIFGSVWYFLKNTIFLA